MKMTRLGIISIAVLLPIWGLPAAPSSAGEDKVLHDATAAQRTIAATEKALLLDIPETGQERRRPPSGWCGEASIQMAMSYYGAYASQRTINRAGKPAHPDLYEEEMPVAMASLGLEAKGWQGKGLSEYMAWVRAELAAGYPVVLGMKINPTTHPDWMVDHFVLAVGCTKETLTYNTTWKRQETTSNAGLASQKKGLSIANPFNTYFGYAVTGMDVKAMPAGRGRRGSRSSARAKSRSSCTSPPRNWSRASATGW